MVYILAPPQIVGLDHESGNVLSSSFLLVVLELLLIAAADANNDKYEDGALLLLYDAVLIALLRFPILPNDEWDALAAAAGNSKCISLLSESVSVSLGCVLLLLLLLECILLLPLLLQVVASSSAQEDDDEEKSEDSSLASSSSEGLLKLKVGSAQFNVRRFLFLIISSYFNLMEDSITCRLYSSDGGMLLLYSSSDNEYINGEEVVEEDELDNSPPPPSVSTARWGVDEIPPVDDMAEVDPVVVVAAALMVEVGLVGVG